MTETVAEATPSMAQAASARGGDAEQRIDAIDGMGR